MKLYVYLFFSIFILFKNKINIFRNLSISYHKIYFKYIKLINFKNLCNKKNFIIFKKNYFEIANKLNKKDVSIKKNYQKMLKWYNKYKNNQYLFNRHENKKYNSIKNKSLVNFIINNFLKFKGNLKMKNEEFIYRLQFILNYQLEKENNLKKNNTFNLIYIIFFIVVSMVLITITIFIIYKYFIKKV